MHLKNIDEIRQVFINLTNSRGLLWTNEVEAILFDKHGFIRMQSDDVKIDKLSLSTIIRLNNTEEVVNYIIVLDYLVDYLKNNYGLSNIEVSILLKEYLSQCNVVKFDKLIGPIGSWIIPSNIIIEKNQHIFEYILSKIFMWLMDKHSKKLSSDYLILRQKLSKMSKTNIDNIILSFIEKTDKYTIKRLLLIYSKETDVLWGKVIKDLRLFIDEKKNSPTSS